MILMQTEETPSTDLIKVSQALSVPCKVVGKGIIVITLSKIGSSLNQLIIVPKNTIIPKHAHPNVFGVVHPVYGFATGFKNDNTGLLDADDSRSYTIEEGEVHGLETHENPFVYLLN